MDQHVINLKALIRTIPDYPKPGIMFRDITTLLGDARAFRTAIDQLGRHVPGEEFRPPPGWDQGFEFTEHGRGGPESAEFSDFFSEIFGRMGREGAQRRGRSADGASTYPGNDHHARILLDLEDSFSGPSRQITLRAPKLDGKGRLILEERRDDILHERLAHGARLLGPVEHRDRLDRLRERAHEGIALGRGAFQKVLEVDYRDGLGQGGYS